MGSFPYIFLSDYLQANTSQEFQDIKVNPSWEIVSRLPATINHKWMNIKIITQPEDLRASYHHIFEATPQLLEQYNPDIVVHLGLAFERTYFAIEKGAERDGYHQYADVDRKVFNKAETKKAWGKSPPRLNSSLDLENVLVKWRTQAGKGVDLRTSDDVGNYVCGFVYYTSLEHFWKKGNRDMPVVFMHVPPLPEKGDVENGVEVTIGLLKALAESFEK